MRKQLLTCAAALAVITNTALPVCAAGDDHHTGIRYAEEDEQPYYFFYEIVSEDLQRKWGQDEDGHRYGITSQFSYLGSADMSNPKLAEAINNDSEEIRDRFTRFVDKIPEKAEELLKDHPGGITGNCYVVFHVTRNDNTYFAYTCDFVCSWEKYQSEWDGLTTMEEEMFDMVTQESFSIIHDSEDGKLIASDSSNDIIKDKDAFRKVIQNKLVDMTREGDPSLLLPARAYLKELDQILSGEEDMDLVAFPVEILSSDDYIDGDDRYIDFYLPKSDIQFWWYKTDEAILNCLDQKTADSLPQQFIFPFDQVDFSNPGFNAPSKNPPGDTNTYRALYDQETFRIEINGKQNSIDGLLTGTVSGVTMARANDTTYLYIEHNRGGSCTIENMYDPDRSPTDIRIYKVTGDELSLVSKLSGIEINRSFHSRVFYVKRFICPLPFYDKDFIAGSYKVGDDGIPVLLGDYRFNVGVRFEGYPLEGNITGNVVVDGKLTSDKMTFDKGTVIKPCNTDLETYIDIYNENGEIIRADWDPHNDPDLIYDKEG